MTRKASTLENTLLEKITEAGVEQPVREHRFHPKRAWRFDFAYPRQMVAIEVEGGTYGKPVICHRCKTPVRRFVGGRSYFVRETGRHNSAIGFEKDAEKYNTAAVMGWTVLRFTRNMIKKGGAVEVIRDALERQRNN
jgi:very-short-patch-repair endonuclease